MAEIDAGDRVVAVPISDCAIGHLSWHEEFNNPDMDQKAYMVTWSGYSRYWQRPIIRVAGRKGHFCAGCFAKQRPPERVTKVRSVRILENA